MKKLLFAALMVAQAMGLPHANAADAEEGFGTYEAADWQTRFVACKKAIYERNWYVYGRDLLRNGGLSTQQAETAFEAWNEAKMRETFFHVMAQSVDRDAYSIKLKQVEDSDSAMFEKDEAAAVREFKRLADYCLFRVYPALIADSSNFAELDKAIRATPIPEDLKKAAKAEFIEKATKAAAK
ncbi:hypothetical protein [Burkholderia ubonensis]|uniref:hypothetical protein n=1 Tax=Burkholderia ubonensis TaxID=101571 RepID=UPI0007525F63|nr:hypothetical protein [Burkholderia ubonensis]KVG72747.1 hypothetical protein WJ34_18650 [Burkholderia ubonensis]KVH26748.1 hypothetical protein WJ37_04625 [Burkholderia ubonensis]KVH52613.1 hypothetical protein WJ38_05035 [Burkholderia ubonensis]KVH84986.1 hypothetical protein WJ43_00495 [Burkholderia ubonensis]KVM25548.1 hypothetical protein WJ55_30125 [Burkholderia ubonensis]